MLLLLLFLIGFVSVAQAQTVGSITGRVIESSTELPLPGATVLLNDTQRGTTANLDGEFELTNIPYGSYTITVRSIGHTTRQIQVSVPGEFLHIELRRSIIDFDDVVITSSPTGSGVSYQPDRAFSGEELNRRRDVTLGQMLDGEPGVSMRSFGPAPARPVIRGFDGERILVLENGERMGDIAESSSDHATALDPQALSRLEVVRGPASLLYGTSALGGVINMITQDVPSDWQRGLTGNLSLNASSVNDMYSGFARISSGGEHHAFTARGSYRNAGDLRTPQGRLLGSDLENIEGSAGYGFRTSGIQGGFSVMGLQSMYGIPEGDADPDERIEIRLNRLATQGNIDIQREGFFDKIQLKFHASSFVQDEVEIEFENGVADEDIEISYDQRAFSISTYFQHQPFSAFDRGVVGFNINGRVLDVGGDEAYTPGEQFVNPAVFVFQELPLTEQLRLQLGVRLDYRYLQARTNDAYPDISESREDFNTAASAGLNFRPSDRSEIGFQIARAHRYPTAEELFADGAHLGAATYEIGDASLKTETSFGFDTFFRYRMGFLYTEVAAFVNYVDQFIAFQPTGQIDAASGFPVFQYTAADARLMGGEVQVAARLSQDWIISAAADYVHGTQISGENEPLPFMPPFRVRLSAEYNTERFWGSATIRQTAKQGRVAPEEDTTNGYTLVNINAGYRFGSQQIHRLVLRGENIFNVTYRDHLSRVEDRQAFMPGRNISLVYSMDF
ncbi:MAG: TonB-dependent receptor [Bacteroidetes bacterium]|nr:TonB-dependent receptor [Bacteroidota bacterium]MCH8524057.1 TonB-dependent receptor [Balneolales bacterium]